MNAHVRIHQAPRTLRKKNWPPNYTDVFAWRQQQINLLRESPELLTGALAFYENNYVSFINHWMDTYDPRKAGKGESLSRMPFILFERQEELVDFLSAMIEGEEDGLIEKCRDMGATWLAAAFSVCLWRFQPGSAIGWGSRKSDLVDRIGDPDSIFEKMRLLIAGLPPEFLPLGFVPSEHMTYMRIINPENGSTITGESGDNIGRGGRKLIYFKDESAHYERPEKIEAALGDNTRTQIDISSVNGLGNVFHRRREAGEEWIDGPAHEGVTNVFVMDWSDHPEKTQEWFDKRKAKAEADGLEHLFAQEISRNYSASVSGTLIKDEWVRAAIDADKKLGFEVEGIEIAGLDVADEGKDKNSLARRKGPGLLSCETRPQGDTGETARWAIEELEGKVHVELQYDCIGVGAGVKSEANRLERANLLPDNIKFIPWAASAGKLNPDDHIIPDDEDTPLNKDFFGNLKAQAAWELRNRLERTYKAVVLGEYHDPDTLISISSDIPEIRQLQKELCQVTYERSTSTMKIIINKSPKGTKSPNMFDSVSMAFWPIPAEEPLAGFMMTSRGKRK